jgi:hypothetical protein
MRWRLACLLLVFGLVCPGALFTRPASASTFVELGLSDLLRISSLVVVGTSAEQTSVWEDADGGRSRRIVTYTHVTVDRVVDGTPPAAADIWVRTLGGQVGDIGQHVDGEAVLVPLDKSLLFLRARSDGTHAVAAMAQGHFPLRAFRAGEPPRIAAASVAARLVSAPVAAAPARAVLENKTVDEAAKIIADERRGRAR